jgi:hypothetical protein
MALQSLHCWQRWDVERLQLVPADLEAVSASALVQSVVDTSAMNRLETWMVLLAAILPLLRPPVCHYAA